MYDFLWAYLNRVLPFGNYTFINTEYEATEGTIFVDDHKSNGNLVVEGFYTPTAQVENNKDNDGECTQVFSIIIEPNSPEMESESLANTILPLIPVTIALDTLAG